MPTLFVMRDGTKTVKSKPGELITTGMTVFIDGAELIISRHIISFPDGNSLWAFEGETPDETSSIKPASKIPRGQSSSESLVSIEEHLKQIDARLDTIVDVLSKIATKV